MLSEALDLAKETIKEVHIRVKLYQRRSKKRYNSQVKSRNFQDHNWILKQRASQTNPNLEEENGKEAHDMTRHT